MTRKNPKEPFKLRGTDYPHLQKIPERLVRPLCLLHAGGNTYHSIAAELNIPLGTVKSRISRARERIIQLRRG